jgi:hypothetical protein
MPFRSRRAPDFPIENPAVCGYTRPNPQSGNMNETTSQVRSNACASYLFLALFFLLARANPALSHPFVRSHARYALVLQALIVGSYLAFGWWGVASGFSVPYVGFSVGRVVGTAISLLATLGLFVGVVAAARGRQPSLLAAAAQGAKQAAAARLDTDAALTESSKSRILASYVPFLGFFAAVSEPHPAAKLGARASAWYAAAAMFLAIFWHADASLSAFTLAYVLLASFVAVQLFVFNRTWRWGWLENLPDAQRAGLLARVAADWLWAALRAVFGRKADFTWKRLLDVRTEAEAAKDILYARRFDDPKFPGAPWLAYLPVFNLLLLLIVRKTRSKWVPAVWQGASLTVLAAALWFSAPAALPFLAFPIALGMANVGREPLYKVPVAYCLTAVARRAWERAERVAKAASDTGKRTESISLQVGEPPRA